jgi:hypothetical protein
MLAAGAVEDRLFTAVGVAVVATRRSVTDSVKSRAR